MLRASRLKLGRLAPWVALLFTLLVVAPAEAHRFAPAVLHLTETAPQQYLGSWSVPPEVGAELAPRFHADCTVDEISAAAAELVQRSLRVDCSRVSAASPLAVSISGLDETSTEAVVHVESLCGSVTQGVLRADADALRLTAGSALSVIASYARLGLKHILGGIDHLLLVLCLFWLVRSRRQLAAALTAFTLGHSVTLFLSALDVLRLPAAPTEALIAWSVVLLAAAAYDDAKLAARASLVWFLPLAFGLVHGLGFAGALAEYGLPADQRWVALAGFNLGVELGQLLVVLVLTVSAWLYGRIAWNGAQSPRPLMAYAAGCMAAFWFFERLLQIG